VAPAPGEAIDSWLEVTANQMGITLGALARAVDLPRAPRPSWIQWLPLDQLRAIQTATGVPTKVVEAMTLSVYDGTALRLDSQSHRLDAAFPFGASVVVALLSRMHRRIARALEADLATRLELCVRGAQLPSR
jgi:hypothetical protein